VNRLFRSAFIPLIAIVLVVWLASNTLMSKTTTPIPGLTTYSQLVNWVQAGGEATGQIHAKLYEVVFNPNKRSIAVTANGKDGPTATVHYPSDQSALQLQNLMEARTPHVLYDSKGTGGFSWTSVIASFLPILLLIGFWIFLMNQMQGGGSKVMSFGKSRAKRMAPDSPKIGFKDVAGVDEAVEELQEIKEFLESPKKFQALGARIPKGVLLYGPPGTGKTLLARAVAGEAGVPFFSISGSDFVEMFVGVGASRVRDLFEQAKQASPCIVFMDEIDAVGRHRGAGLGGGHDEREQTLNQLLVEMDGFEMKDNIILIAATNRPDILDPALLRPGRFDRQIVVDRPDRNGRRKILEVHSKGKPLDPEIDLDSLAAGTPGFTGADLANLVNEAALLAARHGKKTIGQEDLEEGIMRVIAGPEKKARLLSEKEQRITAYHEMGHALVGHFLENTNPIHKITIVSRGQALGLTISLPSEDRYMQTKQHLQEEIAMTLGGRAAEELVFNEVTTGAANDIEKVTHTAKQMVMRYGMSEKLGPRVLGRNTDMPFLGREMGHEPDYSDELAREIDDEVRRIIEDGHELALRVLREHLDELHRISQILIERETIDKEQFMRLIAGENEEDVFVDEDTPALPPPSQPEPERRPEIRPRPFPLPGSAMQPPKPEGAN
jgi:cell division protease FtsH